jgi:8-oxo-dGTP pyrophosphatase MutT (NUDIX family)
LEGEMQRDEDKIWRVESSATVLKDRWIDVRADDCVRADGVRIAPYYVLSYPEWVHIVCLDANRNICLVDQYRHGAGVVVRELPGGMLEPGETPLDGAKRELREETGLSATEWTFLGAYSPNPATHSNRIHIFACRGAEKNEGQALDETEDLHAYFASWPELQGFIEDGSFLQLSHIGILFRARMAGILPG